MYKISEIIPVFNSSLYLDHCLSTVVNQTLKDIEIILVDDESPLPFYTQALHTFYQSR